MRGGSVEGGLGVLWHLPGMTLLWGGQRHSIWEHPGTPSRQLAFLILSRDIFLKGAEVPGEDAEAADGEKEAQGFPMGQWPWLRLFLRIL